MTTSPTKNTIRKPNPIPSLLLKTLLLLVIFIPTITDAFTSIRLPKRHLKQRHTHSSPPKNSFTKQQPPLFLQLRGGGGSSQEQSNEEPSKNAMLLPSILTSMGTTYMSLIETNPILTKSLTAGLIFGLSDITAQRIESSQNQNLKRTLYTTLVGLLYFGPAAHYWYSTIFRLLPGTTLASVLQKAFLGQLVFGPAITIVFFGTSLLQEGTFSLKNWMNKIKQDFTAAWGAGLGFWPLVDLFSYSLISPDYIPLFINVCSFVWTVYLSMISNRRKGAGGEGVAME